MERLSEPQPAGVLAESPILGSFGWPGKQLMKGEGTGLAGSGDSTIAMRWGGVFQGPLPVFAFLRQPQARLTSFTAL